MFYLGSKPIIDNRLVELLRGYCLAVVEVVFRAVACLLVQHTALIFRRNAEFRIFFRLLDTVYTIALRGIETQALIINGRRERGHRVPVWHGCSFQTVIVEAQHIGEKAEALSLAIVDNIVHQLSLLTYLSHIRRASHMRGVIEEDIGLERSHKFVASLILQRNIDAHIVGYYLVAQRLDGLVVLHYLSFLHILGPHVLCQQVIATTRQIETFKGEACDFLAVVRNGAVLGYIHAGQFFQHVFQRVVTFGCKARQVVGDGIASSRDTAALHFHLFEHESLGRQT